MAIWKEMNKDDSPTPFEPVGGNGGMHEPVAAPAPVVARQAGSAKDSIIGGGLVIEGKIEGEGDIHIAGNFKGDVKVNGDVTVEQGARVSAEISAVTVTVGGQVEGNINASTQVKLLQSGQLIGDLKAKSLTVAAGSRMRGRVEFGWDDHDTKKIELNVIKKNENKPESNNRSVV
ncbi:MAG TPA: polymer-forming cytoskeletal protein [Candidatus Binatia bacterium]|nr:polymer-forming cytoskeletal protein [Candidatus Binatia bacterium]